MLIFLILLIVASGLLFIACAPQLGTVIENDRILQSRHHIDGRFRNSVPTSVGGTDGNMLSATVEYFTGKQQREPEDKLPSMKVDPLQIGRTDDLRVTWLGHSTVLIEIDSQVILTDPMFSERASPFSFLGPKRFASDMPLEITALPQIDAVLISHDHYDHLDYRSIRALAEKTRRFYVPLGVGGHLLSWGVTNDQIVELDWWEENLSDQKLKFALTPTRHFSGRTFKRNQTLWGSWVIQGRQHKLFFGGDSGYFPGFKEIGQKYGPFDITMLESGAYNSAWADIHMLPEETVQAHLDLRGELLLPIHWGKFNLSIHSWTEPIERLLAAATSAGVSVVAPLQGQSVKPTNPPGLTDWWRQPKENLIAGEASLPDRVVTSRN